MADTGSTQIRWTAATADCLSAWQNTAFESDQPSERLQRRRADSTLLKHLNPPLQAELSFVILSTRYKHACRPHQTCPFMLKILPSSGRQCPHVPPTWAKLPCGCLVWPSICHSVHQRIGLARPGLVPYIARSDLVKTYLTAVDDLEQTPSRCTGMGSFSTGSHVITHTACALPSRAYTYNVHRQQAAATVPAT